MRYLTAILTILGILKFFEKVTDFIGIQCILDVSGFVPNKIVSANCPIHVVMVAAWVSLMVPGFWFHNDVWWEETWLQPFETSVVDT